MSKFISVYLAAYNLVQLLGYVFIHIFNTFSWSFVLLIFQTLAILEIVHAFLRLVKSSPMATAIQISSRLLILWGVLYMYSEVCIHLQMMLVSWCLADITRYLYYFLSSFMEAPRLLTIFRYNLFLVLYPTGIAVSFFSEIALLWYSLPYAARKPWIYFLLPNVLNFGFSTYELYCLFLLLYIPGSPVMYSHMLAQRKKAMSQKKKVE
ncbi:unnamed protein product [Hydatigera taeniaeformis]|uniref:Very-long-chain (3R)-3-hydroxyacyl-CoA dehydratase n=1 Tax=Hydatigena taeniaeformis TaxID=6205 RepID=A0A0R3X0C5_HYDTA|nr:unnamed protein product [Hydatigera taeniaeformis]